MMKNFQSFLLKVNHYAFYKAAPVSFMTLPGELKCSGNNTLQEENESVLAVFCGCCPVSVWS